jgi:hypothetical protein
MVGCQNIVVIHSSGKGGGRDTLFVFSNSCFLVKITVNDFFNFFLEVRFYVWLPDFNKTFVLAMVVCGMHVKRMNVQMATKSQLIRALLIWTFYLLSSSLRRPPTLNDRSATSQTFHGPDKWVNIGVDPLFHPVN